MSLLNLPRHGQASLIGGNQFSGNYDRLSATGRARPAVTVDVDQHSWRRA